MRRTTIIACILALGLLATPLALADGDASMKGKAVASSHAKRGNATDDRDSNLTKNETSEKPAFILAFQLRMRELRESWRENASEIRESCHAMEKPGENATKDDRLAKAQCIKEGYAAWFKTLRAERKEAKLEMKEQRQAARDRDA